LKTTTKAKQRTEKFDMVERTAPPLTDEQPPSNTPASSWSLSCCSGRGGANDSQEFQTQSSSR